MVSQIKYILEEIKNDPGLALRIPDNANLLTDVGLDSLEMLNFMLKIENDLDIAIDFEKLEYSFLESLSKFADVIQEMAG